MQQHQQQQQQQYEKLRLHHNVHGAAAMNVIALGQLRLTNNTTSAHKEGSNVVPGTQAKVAHARAIALKMTISAQEVQINVDVQQQKGKVYE